MAPLFWVPGRNNLNIDYYEFEDSLEAVLTGIRGYFLPGHLENLGYQEKIIL